VVSARKNVTRGRHWAHQMWWWCGVSSSNYTAAAAGSVAAVEFNRNILVLGGGADKGVNGGEEGVHGREEGVHFDLNCVEDNCVEEFVEQPSSVPLQLICVGTTNSSAYPEFSAKASGQKARRDAGYRGGWSGLAESIL
jgi:hypothetical protein